MCQERFGNQWDLFEGSELGVHSSRAGNWQFTRQGAAMSCCTQRVYKARRPGNGGPFGSNSYESQPAQL